MDRALVSATADGAFRRYHRDASCWRDFHGCIGTRLDHAQHLYRFQRFRENGWSLFGLMQSLSAQGRSAEAAAVRRRFEKAWARADITLTASRIMGRPEAAPSHDTAGTPAPARRSVSLHNEVALDYVEQGDPNGTPVIFLHGVTDSWRSFEPVLPHLPPDVRAFAISLRGHGGSDRPASGYAMRDFARDVDAFMAAAGLRDAVVVGHSMGTAVALRFAIDFPARTRALVLIGGTGNWRANAGAAELATAVATLQDPIDDRFAREFQLSTVATATPTFIRE
jgi:hypothetical protein